MPWWRAPALLRAAVRAGVWAAERSGGLVDPTLVRPLEASGYARSLIGARARIARGGVAPGTAATAGCGPIRNAAWQKIRIDDDSRTVTRPPGVMFDTGGTGKGLCADAVALRLGGYTRFVVDCGGDIAVGGVGAQMRPYCVEIEHPLTGDVGRLGRGRAWGSGHLGPQRAHLATRRRLRPPPAGSEHRPAGVDRADRSDCPGRQRAGGRDALQDGAAVRARRAHAGSSRRWVG